jgi:hypothetical protein
MKTLWITLLLMQHPDELTRQIVSIKRVYVDKLTGGEPAAQMRDLLIASLQNARLFVLTEKEDRADAILRGAAEDEVYTDSFSSSDGVNIRAGASTGTRANRTGGSAASNSGHSVSLGVGENESMSTREHRHEAIAAVRLVNKDGDVIWSTTQESSGAKFRGASADVADKITRQLIADYDRVKGGAPKP